MNEKSLIDIEDSKGNIITMELVLSFNMNNINYIVYKELDNDKMYAAKFIKNINEDFDSNLTPEEIDMVNRVYGEIQNDNN